MVNTEAMGNQADSVTMIDPEQMKRFLDRKRLERAIKAVGEKNAIKSPTDRPKFIIVKQRRNSVTGVVENYESVHCPTLAQAVRDEEHFHFVRHPASEAVTRYWYENGVYHQISDDEFKGRIKYKIERYDPDLVRMRDIREVFELITTDLRYVSESDKNRDELLINFRNGLYDVRTETMRPHTPDVFSTRQIPIDYPADPENAIKKAPTFDRFMWRFCYGPGGHNPGGANRFQFLMEYMATVLSNINGGRFKKSLWMVGPGDCGKSQLLSLMSYLVGADNCHSCDLAQLEARFGTGPIYDKRLIFSPDQRFIKVAELNLFKKFTGNDPINVERKGKDAFTFHYDGLSWFCMNRLPHFGGDDGKHVYDRMIIFQCPESVPLNEQDHQLLDKLKAEAPYIAVWLLTFLEPVVKRGYRFREPDEAEAARKAYALENSDVRTFLSECCVDVDNPGEEVETVQEWKRNREKPTIKAVYEVYKNWCNRFENGYALSMRDWKLKLRELYDVSEKELAPRTRNGNVIPFFCLNRETAKELDYIVSR